MHLSSIKDLGVYSVCCFVVGMYFFIKVPYITILEYFPSHASCCCMCGQLAKLSPMKDQFLWVYESLVWLVSGPCHGQLLVLALARIICLFVHAVCVYAPMRIFVPTC